MSHTDYFLMLFIKYTETDFSKKVNPFFKDSLQWKTFVINMYTLQPSVQQLNTNGTKKLRKKLSNNVKEPNVGICLILHVHFKILKNGIN